MEAIDNIKTFTGYLYVGAYLSFFPIHKEDGDLMSVNYCHHKGGM